MERHFEQQLEKLKTRLIKMCSLVEEQVELAIKSVKENNNEIANLVIDRDKKVDKYDLKVDKICMKLFALQQPVAMDLRLIMSALTINNNLERMGDLASNIARNGLDITDYKEILEKINFDQITNYAHEMVRLSIDAFVDMNPTLARRVMEMDAKLNSEVRNNLLMLLDIMKSDVELIERALHIDRILHNLERLGDHSTNIAENVFFIAEAELVKHRYEEFKAKLQNLDDTLNNEKSVNENEISIDQDQKDDEDIN